MFSEVLKLIPRIDGPALNKMFQTLSQRFATLTKRFGSGLNNALRFAPWAIAAGMFAKILNPLEKTEEILNRILDKSSDAKNTAEELDTSPGKLLRLQALGEAKGVDAETMRMLLGRFQAALAAEKEKVNAPGRIAAELQQEKDPDKRRELQGQLLAAQKAREDKGLLRNFTDEQDTAEAFFKFLQSVQRLDKSQRVGIQADIFGERARGKTAQLFNAPPDELAAILSKLPGVDAFDKAVERADKVGNANDLATAVRNAQDFVTKSALIDEGQVNAIDKSKRLEQAGENEALVRFDALKNTSVAVQELTHKFDQFTTSLVGTILPALSQGINGLANIVQSNLALLNSNWAQFTNSRLYKFLGSLAPK